MVAEKLFNDFMLQFGILDRTLHNQGGEFEIKLSKELEESLCVKHCQTNLYHSMCNGMVKWMDSTLLWMLQILEEINKSRWN